MGKQIYNASVNRIEKRKYIESYWIDLSLLSELPSSNVLFSVTVCLWTMYWTAFATKCIQWHTKLGFLCLVNMIRFMFVNCLPKTDSTITAYVLVNNVFCPLWYRDWGATDHRCVAGTYIFHSQSLRFFRPVQWLLLLLLSLLLFPAGFWHAFLAILSPSWSVWDWIFHLSIISHFHHIMQ